MPMKPGVLLFGAWVGSIAALLALPLLHAAADLAAHAPRVLASLYPLRPGFRPEDTPAEPHRTTSSGR